MKKQNQKRKKSNSFKVTWVRFPKQADFQGSFKKASAYAIVGGKETGKSALAELLASKYTKIIDLYGSRDNEGLAWLRSPFKDKVLLVKGNSVTIDCNIAEVKNASEIKLQDLDNYQAIISTSAFYSTTQEEWYAITRLFEKLWHRTHWVDPWCMLIREASNLLYSRLSIGENQHQAKSYIIYVLREMRHCGFAVALDTIRWHSLDIDCRTIADYTFIKAQGAEGLPKSLKFLYGYFNEYYIMRMPVNQFAVLGRKGEIGFGSSILPPWHKQEHEDLLSLFDIKVKYGEQPYMAEKGSYNVSDYEHIRIVKARVESTESMEALAKILNRSSRTIFTHINKHNNMIHAVGECDKCSRVNNKYAKTIIE